MKMKLVIIYGSVFSLMILFLSQFTLAQDASEGSHPGQNSGQTIEVKPYFLDKPVDKPVFFDESAYLEGNSWMNEFKNVIVINKSNQGPRKQSLRMYRDRKLVLVTKVSTGRESYEESRRIPGCPWSWCQLPGHNPSYSYWSVTPTGFFTVEYLDPAHKSQLWRTMMYNAVFFNDGIAIHQAPDGTEGAIGSRASGGCVRVSAEAAKTIFDTVLRSGKGSMPVHDISGDLRRDASGQVAHHTAFKTLVIVENLRR